MTETSFTSTPGFSGSSTEGTSAASGADRKLIDILRDVGKACRDSAEGYRTSAEDTEDEDLKRRFQELAEERDQQSKEIDEFLRRLGGEPLPEHGTPAGAIHRTFVNLKSALLGKDRRAVIEEVVRGESYTEAIYDKALRHDLPTDIRQAIQRQHDSVRESRDMFKRMQRQMGGRAQGRAGEMAAQWAESGREGLRQAGHYVAERPLTSTLIALGVGFALGALVSASGSRSGRRHY